MKSERIIITNAKVYTLAWDDPALDGTPANNAPFQNGKWIADAEAIVIEDNEILFVGTNSEALSYKHEHTSIVDVQGSTVIPGLVDSHAHPYYFGEDLGKIDLTGISDKTVLLNTLKAKAGDVAEGEWVLGFGYDEGNLSVDKLPTKSELSEVFPNNPVFVIGTHGFTSIANEKALELANINAQTEAPVGGEIKKDENGDPNGIFVNNAAELIEEILPTKTDEDYKEIALYGMKVLAESGYTAWHDAGTNSNYMRAFLTLEKENKAQLRVYTMIQATDTLLMQEWLAKGPVVNTRVMVSVNAVKAYYDASLGQRGALMIDDYSDKAGHRGVSGDDYGFDQDLVAQMMKKGFQVGIHAIGDAGNRDMLDFYASVFEQNPSLKNNRYRIEHAQVVHPDDFQKFKDLNLIVSMEPPHMAEDMNWAEDRVGSERIKGAYAWRTFREHEVPITFNSDLTGSDHNIFYGLYAAITRKNKNREPEGGWYAEQKLSAEEALRAYTTWSAYAAFKEEVKGTIEVGKLADLTIMNIDVLNVGEQNPEALWDGQILGTIVNGKWVYSTFN
ncbi:amidohydrolase [Balneola vulgaris]|uniref:amidohydrolase n=1 Tax=Balneola vulgaris TaxID=287535 RepID=UPI000368B8D4|nr:amidohydrolase [Balneola vulgaris]